MLWSPFYNPIHLRPGGIVSDRKYPTGVTRILSTVHRKLSMKNRFRRSFRAMGTAPIFSLERRLCMGSFDLRDGWRSYTFQLFSIKSLLACLLFFGPLALPAQIGTPPSSAKPDVPVSPEASWQLARTDPAALMQKASHNELVKSYGHHRLLRYRVRKITGKSDTTKEIVETLDGGVARLIAVHNDPLTPEQEQAEEARLHAVDADPSIEDHRRRREMRDAARIGEIMRLLPTAFIYRYAGEQRIGSGTAIRLTFGPNPKFSPPNLEARILTGIRGEVWIDPLQLRVARITGRLFRRVDFGWGLLGVLDPGGTILIAQSNTEAAGWQMSHLALNLQGKAMIVKTVQLHVDETAWDYHNVPSEWHYRDAVQWLLTRKFSSVTDPK